MKDISKVTEDNIKNFKYQLCGNEPKNLNKNRYQDILPCKIYYTNIN